MAMAKDKAYEKMYNRLDSREEAIGTYRQAKERRHHNLGSVRCTANENGWVLANDNVIKKRYSSYFQKLFNEAKERNSEAEKVWGINGHAISTVVDKLAYQK